MGYKMVLLPWQTDWAASCGALQYVYHMMEEQGTLARTLHDGTIENVTEFVGCLLTKNCMPFLVYSEDGRVAAACWFNHFEGRTCRGHFWVNKQFWGRESVRIISHVLRTFLHYKRKDSGQYLFDTVIGITPASNSLAWRLITKCGGKVVGTIPNACHHPHNNQTEDGVLTATTRETVERSA